MAKDVLPEIAQRYQVPETAVRELYRQLQLSGGAECQFACPELGGQIQWTPGMVTVSRPTDKALRARVDGLCCELLAILRGSDTASPAALSGKWPGPAGESWWPADFGHPASAGEQNGVRYAFFPARHRLLIQQGARIDAYDTAEHQITGAAQQQGGGHISSLTFASNHGPITTKELTCVPLT